MKTTRKYLFRGLTEKGEWVYGDLVKNKPTGTFRIFVDFGNVKHADHTESQLHECSGELYIVKPETVGQYTGLTDKNGTKIFEGDIVEAFNVSTGQTIKGFVDFLNGTFILRNITNNQEIRYWSDGNHDWYSIEQYDYFELEVIGNIHQNKELIKK